MITKSERRTERKGEKRKNEGVMRGAIEEEGSKKGKNRKNAGGGKE